MATAWSDPAKTPLDCGPLLPNVDARTRLEPIKTREHFRRWLKRMLSHLPDSPSEGKNARAISAVDQQIWKIAVECVERLCPECRTQLAPTAHAIDQSKSVPPQMSWDEYCAHLRALYVATASPAEADADRLEAYLLNFSSRAQKAMITELWTKGYASSQRLVNLRGKCGVTSNADRNAIDRLVAKAELLWAKDGQIRITKYGAGLVLGKHESNRPADKTDLPTVNKPS